MNNSIAPSMPDTVEALPRDAQGRPIPFIMQRQDENGVMTGYAWGARENAQLVRCVNDRLCAICGQKLAYWIVFAGSAADVEQQQFRDPPLHAHCALYAAANCPHMLAGGWSVADVEPGPRSFLLYRTRRYKLVWIGTATAGHPEFRAAPGSKLPVGPGSAFQRDGTVEWRSVLLDAVLALADEVALPPRRYLVPLPEEDRWLWDGSAAAAAHPGGDEAALAASWGIDVAKVHERHIATAGALAERLGLAPPPSYGDAIQLLCRVFFSGRIVTRPNDDGSFVHTFIALPGLVWPELAEGKGAVIVDQSV